MASYVLSCCSTADLTKEHFEKKDIHVIPFHFQINGTCYKDDLGETIPYKEFYQAMREHAETSTSQVNISEYLSYFEAFLKEGLDIFHVCLSSGLSGTHNSCENAARIAKERYPEREIVIVDSLCASSGYGLFMDALATKRDEGLTLSELRSWAEENKLRVNHLFFSTDLSYYVAGGRISHAAGLFGGILNICPLLHMNGEGRLILKEKPRGKAMAMKRMLKKMEEHADQGTAYEGPCYICHSDCYEDARTAADMVEAAFPQLLGPVEIYDVGTTIGAHTGPGTVALFFFGKEREK